MKRPKRVLVYISPKFETHDELLSSLHNILMRILILLYLDKRAAQDWKGSNYFLLYVST